MAHIDTDALRRERQRKLDAAGTILQAANDDNQRSMTTEEQADFDALMREAEDLRKRYTAQDVLEREMGQALETAEGKPATRGAGSDIGIDKLDIKNYRLSRHIAAIAGYIPTREAKLEMEIDEAVAKRNDKMRGGPGNPVAHIPFEIFGPERRDLTVGTEAADIVETEHGGVIELLRNRMVTRAAGVRVLTGLRGDLLLPKHTAATTNTAWVSEGNAPSEGTPTFGQVKFQPSQLTCYMDVTRQTLLQSSFDVEQFLRNDLATNLAIEIDRTVLHGSGSGAEPAGVFNTGSIGDVAGGTNGAAPTWAHIVELETDVGVANADLGSLAYITNAKVRGKLKNTERVSSTGLFVWQDPANVSPAEPSTPLNGYRAFVTNQVASNLTKGTVSTCSAIFFGNWEEGIVGIWSDLDILVDPYTGGTTGIVRMVAMAFADFQVRHPESFSVMKDATT